MPRRRIRKLNKFINKLRSKLKRNIEPDDINYNQMQALIRNGAILIDVRSPQEYKEGHISGAICIPEYNIQREIKTKIPNIEQQIIVYCDIGGRSKTAQRKLKRMGYKEVYNLYQGISQINELPIQ